MPAKLSAILAATLLATFATAQDTAPKTDKPATKAKDAPTLKVGDPAPELHIAKWVKGDPVTGFEKGKTYIVEFWATWCGPCIQSMPHISELQRHYKDNLTVIGVTSVDRNNPLDKVEKMVADKGDTMAYTVAWDDERKTNDAYMKASKQPGIPTSFVIDNTGKIAYIGHPMWLDKPLEEITKGTWDPDRGMAEVKKAESRLMKVFGTAGNDPEGALKDWNSFENDYPAVAAMFEDTRYALMVRAKDPQAEAIGNKLIEDAIRTKNTGKLITVVSSQEPEAALAAIDRFERANPDSASALGDYKYSLLTRLGDPRAADVARTLIDDSIKTKDPFKLYRLASQQEPDEGLASIKKFQDANPDTPAPGLDFLQYQLLLKTGDTKAAAPVASRIIDAASKREDAAALNEIAWSIVDPDADVANRDLDLAMRAATKSVKLSEEKDAASLDTLARVYFWKGDLNKALEWQKKAVDQAQDPMRPQLESTLKEYEDKAKK